MTPPGLEPGFRPWKGRVLTVRPRGQIRELYAEPARKEVKNMPNYYIWQSDSWAIRTLVIRLRTGAPRPLEERAAAYWQFSVSRMTDNLGYCWLSDLN